MNDTATGATHGIKFKDKIGYAMGDMGGLLTFSLISAFQTMFYTDVLGLKTGQITLLILIARIWDAINDPMWGTFVDTRKPTKYGRFRPYIFGFSIPMAVFGVLMFTKVPGLSQGGYLVWAYVTYIGYGMLYTCVNIPYGSLASVITDDEVERSSLSMWRSIGAGIGGLPGQIILPLIVYKTNTADGSKHLDPQKFTLCVAVLAAISILVYFLHFKLTKERIVIPPNQKKQKHNLFRTIGDLLKNGPFVSCCLASMLLIAFQQYTQTSYNYLFKDYFEKPGLYSIVTICTYLPMALFLPFLGKLVAKFGKKELCAAGMAFSTVVNIILYLLRGTAAAHNPYVFLVLVFFSGAGQTFLVLEVWALVMDVIDYHEFRTHRREEGTAYSLYSFTRKLGQTIAGTAVPALLGTIGYSVDKATAGVKQSDVVINKLYDISTIVPAIFLFVMFILLAFFYKLSKTRVEQLHADLKKVRAEEILDENTSENPESAD